MFRIEDGRRYFYQWDTGRRIIIDIDDSDIVEVHFSYGLDGEAVRREIEEEGGTRFVYVPDTLLQEYGRLRVYAYGTDHTKYYNEFEVRQRAKPDWYDYTEDRDSWTQLTGKVQDLERLTNYHSQLLAEKPAAEDNLLIADKDPIVVKEVPTYVAETAQISSMGCMTYRRQKSDGSYVLDRTYATKLLVTEQNLFDTTSFTEVIGYRYSTSQKDIWGKVSSGGTERPDEPPSKVITTQASAQYGRNVLIADPLYLPKGRYIISADCNIPKSIDGQAVSFPYNGNGSASLRLGVVQSKIVDYETLNNTISFWNDVEITISADDIEEMESKKEENGGYVRISTVIEIKEGMNYYLTAMASGKNDNKENCYVKFKSFCVSTINNSNYMKNTVHYTKILPTDFEDYGLGISENYYNRLDYEHFAYINEVGQYQFDGTEEVEAVQTLTDGSTAYKVTLPRHIELYSKSDPQYTLLSDKYAIRAKNNLSKLSAGEIMYGDTDNEVYIGSNAQNISVMKQEITGVTIIYARKVALVQYFSEDDFPSDFQVPTIEDIQARRMVKILTSTPHDVPNTLEYLYKE